jgi:glutamate racemase
MNPVKIDNLAEIENPVGIKNRVGIESIAPLFAKKKVTILITDSGLGGLSVFARMAARYKRDPIFSEVSLIYYNAWPQQDRGYHRLKDENERIRVFERALAGMEKFHPDIIMIACNTLSILFPKTGFYRRKRVPVIDIIRFGVDMVYESLTRNADKKAVIMGTAITIASGIHRLRLVEKGISPKRLVSQPCDQLATQIEKDPAGDTVAELVETFTGQAAKQLGPNGAAVFVALFCTHFGYCRDLIKDALENKVQAPVTILDPNERMADFLFAVAGKERYHHTPVDLRVVSRIIWDQHKVDAISKIVEKQSAETAQALRNYERIPDLFTF